MQRGSREERFWGQLTTRLLLPGACPPWLKDRAPPMTSGSARHGVPVLQAASGQEDSNGSSVGSQMASLSQQCESLRKERDALRTILDAKVRVLVDEIHKSVGELPQEVRGKTATVYRGHGVAIGEEMQKGIKGERTMKAWGPRECRAGWRQGW